MHYIFFTSTYKHISRLVLWLFNVCNPVGNSYCHALYLAQGTAIARCRFTEFPLISTCFFVAYLGFCAFHASNLGLPQDRKLFTVNSCAYPHFVGLEKYVCCFTTEKGPKFLKRQTIIPTEHYSSWLFTHLIFASIRIILRVSNSALDKYSILCINRQFPRRTCTRPVRRDPRRHRLKLNAWQILT